MNPSSMHCNSSAQIAKFSIINELNIVDMFAAPTGIVILILVLVLKPVNFRESNQCYHTLWRKTIASVDSLLVVWENKSTFADMHSKHGKVR